MLRTHILVLGEHTLRCESEAEALWLRVGHPAHIIQKAMGHADLRTTMGYERLVAQDLLSLVGEPMQEELREMVK